MPAHDDGRYTNTPLRRLGRRQLPRGVDMHLRSFKNVGRQSGIVAERHYVVQSLPVF